MEGLGRVRVRRSSGGQEHRLVSQVVPDVLVGRVAGIRLCEHGELQDEPLCGSICLRGFAGDEGVLDDVGRLQSRCDVEGDRVLDVRPRWGATGAGDGVANRVRWDRHPVCMGSDSERGSICMEIGDCFFGRGNTAVLSRGLGTRRLPLLLCMLPLQAFERPFPLPPAGACAAVRRL